MITRIGPIEYENGEEFGFMLMSDLHIGSANTDEARIRKDLDMAANNGWPVFINGDWAELIIFQDRKRYTPNVLDSGIACDANQVDRHVDKAFKLLEPYADFIYMIGSGNHETAILKYHGMDVTKRLIDRLNGSSSNADISHGGYTGGIVLSFQRKGPKNSRPAGCQQYKIWYHHGFGGSAPITKGMIDFSRVNTFVEDADLTWLGHKHQRTVNQTVALRFPRQGSELVSESRWNVMTSHYHKYSESQFTKDGYYKPDWNRERGAPPSPSGGAILMLTVDDHRIQAAVSLTD